MRTTKFTSFWRVACFLFAWASLSHPVAERARVFALCAFTPAIKLALGVKEYLQDRPLAQNKKHSTTGQAELEIENQKLKAELELAKEWILQLTQPNEKIPNELFRLFEMRSQAIPALVIYRDPATWSNTFWIGVGEEENEKIGYPVVRRNSPVVLGNSLVGIVDFVGRRQSRVRLITDSSLTPAVRVFRNSEYLAKGELSGNGAPFWHTRTPILKGVGFNYDFSDKEGKERDLRSDSLIVKGDHLVTSGLDGVFPKGISVAVVSKVFPLKEGSFAYEIEADPTASDINDLKVVFVLPSKA